VELRVKKEMGGNMPKLIDVENADSIHRTLLCVEDVETEFGLFCMGAHAMLLSLIGGYISREEHYRMDMKEDFPRFCGITHNLYDWFDTAKRKQAIKAEVLKANHQMGEQILATVRKVREEDGRKVWEKEDGGE